MNLTHRKAIMDWPETHYVYIEKIGPFQETAQKCWQDLHQLILKLSEVSHITGYMSLYNPKASIYRAGVSVAKKFCRKKSSRSR